MIVKKHRDQKAAERLKEEQQKEQAELNLGEKLEERNERDKVMWEAVYGDQAYRKAPAEDLELGAGTTANSKTASTSGIAAHSFETVSVKSAGNSEKKAQLSSSVTLPVASEASVYETPFATTENLISAELEAHEKSIPGSLREPSTDVPTDPTSTLSAGQTANSGHSQEGSVQSEPQVVPLPFNVSGHDFKDDDDERSSIATFAISDRAPSYMSMRLSSSSLLRKFPKPSEQRCVYRTPTEEVSAVSLEDDRASSVAATFDGVEDDLSSEEEGRPGSLHETRSLEKPEVETVAEPLCGSSTPLNPEKLSNGYSDEKPAFIERAANEGAWEPKSIDDDESATTEIFVPAKSTCGSIASRKQRGAVTEAQRARSTKSATASELNQGELHPASFRDQLPEGASKVEMAYRTNEWAKHLDRAEMPLVEDLKESSSTSEASTLDAKPVMEESAAPVDVRQLEQNALTAEPRAIKVITNPEAEPSQQPYLKRSASWSRDSLPSQRNRQLRESSLRRASYGGLTNRSGSQNPLQSPRGFRTSSTAMHNSPLVESPIEEGVESFFPPRGEPTASAIPQNTLMAKRNSKLQNRYSTTSLTRSKSSTFPHLGSPLDAPDAEDLPLAQRKSLLKLQSRRSSNPTSPRTSAAYVKRHPSGDSISPGDNRENMVTAWHTSLRNDSKANLLSQRDLERRRSEMLGEKRRASADLQAAGAERARRESQRDGSMRRGDMLDRHREAMRKLQASVNV